MEIAEKLFVGDVVEMRKTHPCGGKLWTIDRVGADVGLVCQTCGRRVLLTRRKFARGAKRFVVRGQESAGGVHSKSSASSEEDEKSP